MGRKKDTMPDLKPGQVWEIYSDTDKRWRRAKVANVSGPTVELLYQDMPGAPDVSRVVRAQLDSMEHDPLSIG